MILKVIKYGLGLFLALQLAPQCFAQQASIFVKFDSYTCQGAMNAEFPNYSAASSFALGGTQTVALGSTGGQSVGRANFADTKIVKPLDDCTPKLFQALAGGTHLTTVTVSIMTPATSNTPAVHLLDVVMTDVIISGDEFAEAVGGRPSEVITLNWTKIQMTHVPSGTQFTWDQRTNSAF
jgi:type VI secretion system Hcp family effector